MEKSFAYRACVVLRAYEEHVKQFSPVNNVEAHKRLMPTLMSKFKAYLIFSRDLDSAFGYEATREHKDSFRAPFTTNERRLDEVQSMETGWLKRIAVDMVQCVLDVGVPLNAEEVKWMFENRQRQCVRPNWHSSNSGGVDLTKAVVAVNELCPSDYETLIKNKNYFFVAVSSGFESGESYEKVFEQLRDVAKDEPEQSLASALFVEREMEGEYIEPHPLVAAANLPKIKAGDPTYIFAIEKNRYEFACGAQVRTTLCKMIGYDENDLGVTIEKIMADTKAQAERTDAFLLPDLTRIEAPPAEEKEQQQEKQQQQPEANYGMDDVEDDAFIAAMDQLDGYRDQQAMEAEAATQETN